MKPKQIDIPPGGRPLEFTRLRTAQMGQASLEEVRLSLTMPTVLRTTPSATSLYMDDYGCIVHCRCGRATSGDAGKPIACASCGSALAVWR